MRGVKAPMSAKRARLLSNLSIGLRISGLAGLLLVLLLVVAGFSGLKVNSLGHEIEGIAERDMPLAQIVTGVEVRQLEQSIEFERAVRFGGRT